MSEEGTGRRVSAGWGAPPPKKSRDLAGGLHLGAVAEQFALLDEFRDLGGHHLFPGRITGFDALQHVAGENVQIVRIASADAVEVMVLEEVGVQVAEPV